MVSAERIRRVLVFLESLTFVKVRLGMRTMLHPKAVSGHAIPHLWNDAERRLCMAAMMYGLTMSLKNEIVKIAPRGRVNTVAPGWVKTVSPSHTSNDSNSYAADNTRV
jgi:hypothetical protein